MAQPTPGASLMAALHARYEATQTEYAAVELADMATRPKSKERENNPDARHYGTALLTSEHESDALRNAILYQVPDSWSDALILQFQIVCAYDIYSCASEPDEQDNERLQVAIDTLFDFMCAEVRAEAGEIGAGFAYGAARAFQLRRLRTGMVEA
jgi:hypothetical protein